MMMTWKREYMELDVVATNKRNHNLSKLDWITGNERKFLVMT